MAFSDKKVKVTHKRKHLFGFLGEDDANIHYASYIPPLPSMYTGIGPYTSMYPAPAVRRTSEVQMTPEQAYPEVPQTSMESYSMPNYPTFSYNPFEGLGFFENPLLDSEYVPPLPTLPAPVQAPKPVMPVFSYNPFANYWKK